MKPEHAMTWKYATRMARSAAAVALFAACGQDAVSSDSGDAASAYAALSASVQACTDQKDQCVAAANGDSTKVAACDAAAESCMKKTPGAQTEAKRRLGNDAESCMKQHPPRQAGAGTGAGGSDASGQPEMHKCVERHAPASPACMSDLFACLDKTDLKTATANTQLDQATKDAIVACVQTAHTCFMTDMASHRPSGRGAGGGAPHGEGGHRERRAVPHGRGRPPARSPAWARFC